MSEFIPFKDPDEEGITQGMRHEAERLSASLAEQAVRTSQQAALLFQAFEMAIEREQDLYAPGNVPSEDSPQNKVIHEALGAIRSALNVILEADGRG